MKTSKTKRSLVKSMLSLILCLAMLISATFAWFTDTVTSGSNRIVAGNLDIDLVMDKGGDDYVSVAGDTGDIFNEAANANNSSKTLWEPGKTQIVYLGVRNLGTLALKYNILLTVEDGGLADVLEYAFIDGATKADLASATSWSDVKAAASNTGSFGDFTYDGTTNKATIPAAENGVLDEIANGTQNETDYFALAVHMDEDAGNDYMSKRVTIDVKIEATQYTAESDSFDNQYDANASGEDTSGMHTVTVKYYKTNQDAQLTTDTITVADGTLVIINNTNITIGDHSYTTEVPSASLLHPNEDSEESWFGGWRYDEGEDYISSGATVTCDMTINAVLEFGQ